MTPPPLPFGPSPPHAAPWPIASLLACAAALAASLSALGLLPAWAACAPDVALCLAAARVAVVAAAPARGTAHSILGFAGPLALAEAPFHALAPALVLYFARGHAPGTPELARAVLSKQTERMRATCAIDMWSLGLIIFELFARQAFFADKPDTMQQLASYAELEVPLWGSDCA